MIGLARDVDRLPPYEQELTAAQRERVERLLAGPVVSLHDHPIRLPDPLTPQTWAEQSSAGTDRLGHAGLRASGLDVVLASSLADPDQQRLLRWAARLREDVDPDGPRVLLALEDLGSIGTDLDGIVDLHAAGYRSAGLVYNTGNALGGGLGQAHDDGLTSLGREAVAVMNGLGMLVDLSHVGDRTSIEAARSSSAPVVITHAGARACWPSPRMKPDDVLRAVADTGGVIGVEAAPGSTRVHGRPAHDLDAVMTHVAYIAELVGVEHVGLGPDTFFGDHAGLYAAAGWAPVPVPGHEDVPLPDHVAGMENPAEAPRNAACWLVRHGWSDADIAKVLGVNAQRVLDAVLR
ncbi:dipeptidase [Pseudonocardia kunmingensis]|uniref:Membrane dipeptidase n=1 Tax=Pseudonocardia kunmingensis TaxID=630975 RepID=A0A543CXX0_9PSEU|nr:membrane dipeptidase [Pseudonocardia kunmingensis]TQM01899.1 membrane dipeptidase [Pseudonocardia kunmingensis]